MTTIKQLSATKLNVDPNTTNFFLGVMALILIFGFIYLTFLYYTQKKKDEEEELEARNHIKFNPTKSIITSGHLGLEIPNGTLEYFVCKAVFSNPNRYHSDLDVENNADNSSAFSQRAVYKSVIRINNKARNELQLKEDLLKRSRERTILNDRYKY
jgi:hypothetical protein